MFGIKALAAIAMQIIDSLSLVVIPLSVLSSCVIAFWVRAGLGHSIGFLDPVQQHVVRKRLASVASSRMRPLRLVIVRTRPGPGGECSVIPLQVLWGLSLAALTHQRKTRRPLPRPHHVSRPPFLPRAHSCARGKRIDTIGRYASSFTPLNP
jgi:hypothetical protein